jgi:hypothetical protein
MWPKKKIKKKGKKLPTPQFITSEIKSGDRDKNYTCECKAIALPLS